MSSTASTEKRFATGPVSRALLDTAVAAAALAGTLFQLSHGGITPTPPGSRSMDLLGLVLVVCSTAPLVVWRRFPLTVFVATAASTVLLAGLGYPVDLALGPSVALYYLAASRDRRRPWTPAVTIAVAGLLVAYLVAAAAAQGGFPVLELLHTGLAAAGAWFAGERTRLRREQMAEFKERALRAERDADRERLLAVAEERARIARDLHDSAGHAISVIAVRAGAGRLRHREDPERSLRALTAIEDLARQTAGEIDQIVATLREGTAANGPPQAPPGLASLDSLIEHHTTTGLRVAVERTGVPRPLSGIADQAAFRILQEALRNAARHGGGTAAVALGFGDDGLDVTVTNPVTAADTPRSGGGHGLIGMRERATLLGGSFDVDRANGSFRVHALIPYGEHGS